MKNKNKVTKKSTAIQIIIGAIIGAALSVIGLSMGFESNESNKVNGILVLVITIGSLYLSLVIATIVHEAGHLVGGLLSGYEFASFRVFSITFINENGRLAIKKYNISGTMGQCLMAPPELVNGNYPFALYNLGGGVANFLLSGVSFPLYLLLKDVFSFAGAVFIPIIGYNIILGAMNLIPLKMSKIANDGYNLILLRKSEQARRSFYLGLKANESAMKGIRYKDMPTEYSELPSNYNDSISVLVALNRFNCLMDNHDFAGAKELAETILVEASNMIELYKNELRCELLFLEIIGERRSEEIEQFYTNELKKYIKANGYQLSKRRLIYAYQKLVALDKAETDKALIRFNKTSKTYPFRGELALEFELIGIINDLSKTPCT